MSRLSRLCPAGVPVHIIQRGHDRNICFGCSEDYRSYLSILSESSKAYGVSVHAWVLMTNHIHMLATPRTDQSASRMMQYLGRNYVRWFNRRYRRTGTLWEGRFKSCIVDSDEYFFSCQRYIELNPVRAGMVSTADEYRWSSYRRNALGHPDSLVEPSDLYRSLGHDSQQRQIAYRNLFDSGLSEETIEEIRNGTTKGLAYGSEKFKDQIETLHQRRVKALPKGPRR